MNYLTKFIIILLICFNNGIFAKENKIIFQVNDKIYTSIDLKNRIKYLEILNSINYEPEMEIEIINDYFNSVIYFEYIKNNNFLNSILEEESRKIFNQIVLDNKEIKNKLKEDIIKKNINFDFARKIVLENLLDSYKEYIFSNPKDISFIYNYIIKYITVPKNNKLDDNKFNDILTLQNFKKLITYLSEEKINYYLEEVEITDFNKINKKIKNLINLNNKFLFEKNSDFYRIIKVDKKLDVSEGVYYKLINFETSSKLIKNQENCKYIKSLNNIKSSKEYEFNRLNNKIKNNLISINDFIVFESNKLYNYIFLCEIRVDENFLKEININKKINIIAKSIELDFINKYSILYNTKKIYE